MNEFVLLLTMLTMGSPEASHWARTKGGLMVTAVSMWKVNQAETIDADSVIKLFAKSHLAVHKEPEFDGVSNLVFQPGATIPLKKASEMDGGGYVLDENDLVAKLRELKLKIPTDMTYVTKSQLRKAEEIVKAASDEKGELKKWSLFGSSSFYTAATGEDEDSQQEGGYKKVTAPMADYSLLIEWGHPTAIDAAMKKLEGTDKKIDPALIFARHADKIPVRLEIHKSDSEKEDENETEVESKADPLYFVRFANEKKGFLEYLSLSESPARIIAIEVPSFEVAGNVFKVDVPAQCFLDKVVRAVAKKDLKLPALKEGVTTGSSKYFVKVNPKTDKEKWMLRLELTKKTKESDKTTSVRFVLKNGSPSVSYSAILEPSEDAKDPVKDNTPVTIYNEQCQAITRPRPVAQKDK